MQRRPNMRAATREREAREADERRTETLEKAPLSPAVPPRTGATTATTPTELRTTRDVETAKNTAEPAVTSLGTVTATDTEPMRAKLTVTRKTVLVPAAPIDERTKNTVPKPKGKRRQEENFYGRQVGQPEKEDQDEQHDSGPGMTPRSRRLLHPMELTTMWHMQRDRRCSSLMRWSEDVRVLSVHA
ncbi:hypothetical protein PC122_g10780 [Phytophthora cactorum]|nr:hypothetical protein PC122_g10780 [Phytophthora cactorum]